MFFHDKKPLHEILISSGLNKRIGLSLDRRLYQCHRGSGSRSALRYRRGNARQSCL
jgi:hypothetical protein